MTTWTNPNLPRVHRKATTPYPILRRGLQLMNFLNNPNLLRPACPFASSEHARGFGRPTSDLRSLRPRAQPDYRFPAIDDHPTADRLIANAMRTACALLCPVRATTSDEMPARARGLPDPRQANLAKQPPVVGTRARTVRTQDGCFDDVPVRSRRHLVACRFLRKRHARPA